MFKKKKKEKEKKEEEVKMELILLKSVKSLEELSLVKQVLESNGVPYIESDRKKDGHSKGKQELVVFGRDILVEKRLYERGKNILNGVKSDSPKNQITY